MSGTIENAGCKPAFMEYRLIGERYKRLADQFRAGKQVHAYLLAGPQGIGKLTFARYLASALFCQDAEKPCRTCASCNQILTGKHASVLEISPENKKAITVDRIREVVSLSATHSLDGRERVIIIEPMESLTPQAQNSLLKALEDPSTSTVYLLLSHDTSSLLDTILSRCSIFKLTPWPGTLLMDYLKRSKYPSDAVKRAAVLAGGNVGEAISILTEQLGGSLETAIEQLLNVSNSRDAVRCSTALKDMSGNSDQILFRLERYLQQCMLVKSGLLPADMLNGTPWGTAIRSASLSDLVVLTDHIFKARKLKMSNVNWQSNIDQLTSKLLEAKYKWQKS